MRPTDHVACCYVIRRACLFLQIYVLVNLV